MNARGNHSPEDVQREPGSVARLPEWAREREDRQWYEAAVADRPPQQTKRKKSSKLIVVVEDEGGDWAKARLFDDPEQAAALVQMLVEGGLAPEQVSVFSATQMVVNVAYQPLVELNESRRQDKPPGRVHHPAGTSPPSCPPS